MEKLVWSEQEDLSLFWPLSLNQERQGPSRLSDTCSKDNHFMFPALGDPFYSGRKDLKAWKC